MEDTLTFEIAINSLKFKELDLKMKDKDSSKGQYVRGKLTTKSNHKGGNQKGKNQTGAGLNPRA